MATSSSSAAGVMTPAERLAAQHAASELHQPTIEEVVDEEDVKHPPPSAGAPLASEPVVDPPSSNGDGAAVSAKAAGKQRADDSAAASSASKKAGASLNTASEEAFPSLAATKPSPSAPAAAGSWGTRSASVRTNGAAMPSAAPAPMKMPVNTGRPVQMPGRAQYSMSIDTRLVQKRKTSSHSTLQELLKSLNRKLGVQITTSSAAGKTTFHASGPTLDAVNRALREIAAQWTADQSVTVPVPASLLPQIIGKQGAKIKELQERTGAKIQADRNRPDGDDEDVNIQIQGNPVTAEAARREILALVNERTSTVNVKMSDVPPELFPFIAGPHRSRIAAFEDGRDVRVKIPHYQTWRTQPPAQAAAPNQPPRFGPQDGYAIQIQGEREATRQIQAEIQRQVAELQAALTTGQVDVEREKHKFVLGNDERDLHNFMHETGCSIILPPPGDDSETIHIVGPPDKIDNAVNKAMDNALSMAMTSVDISRQHANAARGAQAHAQDVARYLRQRQAIAQLEKMHEANIVVAENAPAWQIYSRDGKNGMRARSDITNLVAAHPPARFRSVDLHPYYQRHIHNQHAQVVRDQYGVHLVVAEPDVEDSPLLLVYEAPDAAPDNYQFPRSKPSADEVAQFEKALADTEQFIMGLLGAQREITQSSFDTPSKYREKVQRFVDAQAKQSQDGYPVEFMGFSRPAGSNAQGSIPMSFRGPTSEVDAYRRRLQEYIEEQIRDEAERDYSVTFDFPQKFANQLIGKKGENINKLRLEHDVEIQVQDGKVEVKGPQRKAHAARAAIQNLARKVEDDTTHVIKVKPQFHGNLIGPGGKNIRRLQERYGVHINFPHAGANASDSQSVADGASDAGGPSKNRRQAQAPDEVVIRGPSKGANEARKEITDDYEYLLKTSQSASVSVAQQLLPSLIGAGGKELDNLRLETGAIVDVPGSREEQDPSGRVEIKIRGTKEAVDKARKIVEARSKTFDDSVRKTLNIDKKHHRALIGRNGDNILDMVVKAGGAAEERNRLVRFPAVDSQETSIQLNGQRQVVEALAAAMEAFALRRESQVTGTINVAPERHGALIGSGGEMRKKIESQFEVSMNIPDRNVTGPARSAVKLSGLPENVEKAKAHIAEMTKGPESETMQVPVALHHVLFDAHSRKLQGMNVRLDHAGHARPARTKASATRPNGAGASMPLITDASADSSAAADVRSLHGWEVQGPKGTGESDEKIPWVLKAQEASRVAEARQLLLDALAKEMEASTGYLVLPEPSMNQYVIGQGGSTINAIRDSTGCSIDVPKKGSSSEAITIRGSKDSLEEAKEQIIEAVMRGTRR